MTEIRHSRVYARNLKTPAQPVKDEKLKVETVRKRLNCSRSFVYKLMDEGKLPFITLGEKNGKRVRESDLVKFEKSLEAKSGA